MTALSLGPFLFAGERLAAILAIVFFLGVSALIAYRVDGRLGTWALNVVPLGIAAARLGHVALHFDSFWKEPLRIFYIWEGGFTWWAGIGAAALYALLAFPAARLRAWSFGTLAAAALVWNVAFQLVATTTALAAPNTAFASLAGGDERLPDFEGKPVVLNLWATWCPPCRREMPMMAAMAKERDDVVFVFANQGEGADAIGSYLDKAGLAMDHILLDTRFSLARHYGVQGYPATLFLDKEGVLKTMHLGETSRESIEATLADMADDD